MSKTVLTAGVLRKPRNGLTRVLYQRALSADGQQILAVERFEALTGLYRRVLLTAAKDLQDYRDAGFPGTIARR